MQSALATLSIFRPNFGPSDWSFNFVHYSAFFDISHIYVSQLTDLLKIHLYAGLLGAAGHRVSRLKYGARFIIYKFEP